MTKFLRILSSFNKFKYFVFKGVPLEDKMEMHYSQKYTQRKLEITLPSKRDPRANSVYNEATIGLWKMYSIQLFQTNNYSRQVSSCKIDSDVMHIDLSEMKSDGST